ncbi:hypothetical protein EV127DRAFT_417491 [Xylaria flabelliformis]|nr:hypothetical protein EV127DRAFT_417491 [Xylaria flabelliformis]
MASSPSHVAAPNEESLWSSPPQVSSPLSPPSNSPTLPGPPPSALSPSAPTDDDSEVQQAYKAIEDLFYERYHSLHGPVLNDPSFRLNEESFLKLRQQLEDHNLLEYFDYNLRYNWVLGILSLHIMPETAIHAIIVGDLTEAINQELNRLAAVHPTLLDHRQQIFNGYTGHICSSTFVDYKSPDGQFCYKPDKIAPFLLEVSYGQHISSLKRKVQEYFQSLLSVQTILGIDITAPQPVELRYQHNYTHTARAILWVVERSAVPGTEDDIVALSDSYFC